MSTYEYIDFVTHHTLPLLVVLTQTQEICYKRSHIFGAFCRHFVGKYTYNKPTFVGKYAIINAYNKPTFVGRKEANMVQIRIDEEDYEIVRQRAVAEGRTIKGTLHTMIAQSAQAFQPMAMSTPVNVPNLMDDNQLQQYIAEQQAKVANHHKPAPKPAPQPEMSEAELKKIIAARNAS